MKRLFYILAIAGLFTACSSNVLTSQYQSLPISGWRADSTLVFPFVVSDSLTHYDVLLSVRHTDDYPYQNIWLFTDVYLDSACVKTDTLEYYLANQRGQWLGNGFGRYREMPMLYLANMQFAACGNYRIEVRQGMREDALRGISDFGVIIEKTHGQE